VLCAQVRNTGPKDLARGSALIGPVTDILPGYEASFRTRMTQRSMRGKRLRRRLNNEARRCFAAVVPQRAGRAFIAEVACSTSRGGNNIGRMFEDTITSTVSQ